MPYSHPDQFRRLIPKYIETLWDRKLSIAYIEENRRVLMRAHDLFRQRGKRMSPKMFRKEDIHYYLDNLNGKWKYREQCFLIFRQFLIFCKNQAIKDMRLRFPRDMTTKADWLNREQIDYVRKQAMDSPLLNMIFELGFNNGARRIGIMRFTVADAQACISTGVITLKEKGPMGGQSRSFYCHPDTPKALQEYLEYRMYLLSKCDIPFVDPPELIIYVKGGQPRTYTRSGMDRILTRFSKRVGLHVKYHTARRSMLRELHKSGTDLPTIQKIAGHESVDQTVRYIGIRLDDTRAAMHRLATYQEEKTQLLAPSPMVQLVE